MEVTWRLGDLLLIAKGFIEIINLRPGRPLGEKWRPLVGKVGEWYVESRYL
jgi:hypothetical protein